MMSLRLRHSRSSIFYYFFFRGASTDGLASQVKSVDGVYVTLTGLQAYSSYRLRVQAVTRMGSGPYSQPITCTTDETGNKPFNQTSINQIIFKPFVALQSITQGPSNMN